MSSSSDLLLRVKAVDPDAWEDLYKPDLAAHEVRTLVHKLVAPAAGAKQTSLERPDAPVSTQVLALFAAVTEAGLNARQRAFGAFRFVARVRRVMLFYGFGVYVILPFMTRDHLVTLSRLASARQGDTLWMKDYAGDLNELLDKIRTTTKVVYPKYDKHMPKHERQQRPSKVITHTCRTVYLVAAGAEALELHKACRSSIDFKHKLHLMTFNVGQTPAGHMPRRVTHEPFTMRCKSFDLASVSVLLNPRVLLLEWM